MTVCECVTASEWLSNYKKADELITGKAAEKKQLLEKRQRLIDIATDISSRMPDGMPFCNTGTVSKKVENAVISKVLIDGELKDVDEAIELFLDFKKEVTTALEKLPTKYYAVLHRYYIRGMTIEAIAEDTEYSERQVHRIKKEGLVLLEEFIGKEKGGA